MVAVRDPSALLKSLVGIAVRDSGAVLRTINTGKARDSASALKVIFSGFKVSVSPTSAYGYAYSHSPRIITTYSVTGTVTGGTAPFTYAWSFDFGGWSATNPTGISSAFSSGMVGPGDSDTNDVTLTVTDANGATAVSDSISLNVTNTGT